MGTTMSFYNIFNSGFTPEQLQGKMQGFSKSGFSSDEKPIEGVVSPDLLKQTHDQVDANSTHLPEIFEGRTLPQTKDGVIAYNASAKWLPFFEVNCCEGYISSSEDAKKLSQVFGTPVLAFSIFDSDILFVSYSDAEKNIVYDFVKPNFEEFEDVDTGSYSTAFPEFMLDFCNQSKLKEIWDEPDVVFADDRMEKICELIQAKLLYDPDHMPEGFQSIYAI